jgi:hypothetical protein
VSGTTHSIHTLELSTTAGSPVTLNESSQKEGRHCNPILKKKKAVNLLSEHFIVDHLIPPSHSLKAQSVLDCLIVGTAGLMDSLQPELMRSDQMIGWGEALTTFNISPLLLPFYLLLPFERTPIYQPEYLDLVALDRLLMLCNEWIDEMGCPNNPLLQPDRQSISTSIVGPGWATLPPSPMIPA